MHINPIHLSDLVDAVIRSGQRVEIKLGDGRSLFLISRNDADRLTDLDIENTRANKLKPKTWVTIGSKSNE
jgi:hypothetical protein